MKTLILFILISTPLAAQMGSIDDPVAGSSQTSHSSDRITFLKADIAEKTKLYKEEVMRAYKHGQSVQHSAYADIIAQDKAELKELQGK